MGCWTSPWVQRKPPWETVENRGDPSCWYQIASSSLGPNVAPVSSTTLGYRTTSGSSLHDAVVSVTTSMTSQVFLPHCLTLLGPGSMLAFSFFTL